jgi:glycosyltransferase involved in cell wall biosynthesis
MLMSVYGPHAIGGAERTAAQVAQALGARGHQVSLISLSAPGSAFNVGGETVSAGVRSYTIPLVQSYDPYGLAGHSACAIAPTRSALSRAWWHLRDVYNQAMVRSTKALLAQLHPDVLWTHTLQGFSVGVWGAAQKLGIPVLHMTHDHALICPATAMTRGANACEKVCAQCQCFSTARHVVAAKPQALVAPSRVVLERHARFGWFQSVTQQSVIPNALPSPWPDVSTAQCLARWAHAPHTLRLGYLGRMDESKGVDTLLQALALLPKRYVGRWQLQLGGAGSVVAVQAWYEQGTARALAANAKTGSAAPADAVTDVASWAQVQAFVQHMGVVKASEFLIQQHVLICPSRAHETFCNVVMEAASLGCPAIVSDRGALPERVEQGRSGWLFPAGDAQALCQQIQALLDDPSAIAPKALAALQSKAQYDPVLQADRFEALLDQVRQAHPRQPAAL